MALPFNYCLTILEIETIRLAVAKLQLFSRNGLKFQFYLEQCKTTIFFILETLSMGINGPHQLEIYISINEKYFSLLTSILKMRWLVTEIRSRTLWVVIYKLTVPRSLFSAWVKTSSKERIPLWECLFSHYFLSYCCASGSFFLCVVVQVLLHLFT